MDRLINVTYPADKIKAIRNSYLKKPEGFRPLEESKDKVHSKEQETAEKQAKNTFL